MASAPPPAAGHPEIPSRMTLSALQHYVAQVVAHRGYTSQPDQIFILLVEEVGELAREFKKARFYPESFDPAHTPLEMADVLLYLLDLANHFGQNLEALWPLHQAENGHRFAHRWGGLPPAPFPPAPTLNLLARHLEAKRAERGFEDDPHTLLLLLMEEVGELATELRKGWKGQSQPDKAGREIIDSLTYLLRLATLLRIDLERAVADKERHNATRSWAY